MRILTSFTVAISIPVLLILAGTVAAQVPDPALPFRVPSRATMVAGFPDAKKVCKWLAESESHLKTAIPLLLCTDPHSGEEILAEWTQEISDFGFESWPLEGSSMWVVLDDCSDGIGDLAILFVHPKLDFNEQQKTWIKHFSGSVFSFLTKLFSNANSLSQAKLLERVVQWERNHVVDFRSGLTLVLSSPKFASKLAVSDSWKGSSTTSNRSFSDAFRWVMPDADFICYLAPANAKAIATGTGFISEWTIQERGYPYRERPWAICSGRIESAAITKVHYRCMTRSTIPYTGEDQLWTIWQRIPWVPKFQGDVSSLIFVHRDLRKYEKLLYEIDPKRAEAIAQDPILAWDFGLNRTSLGGLNFGFTLKRSGLDEALEFANWKVADPLPSHPESVEVSDGYYSVYSEGCHRLGRPNLFGNHVVKGDYRGFPAWLDPDSSGDYRIAVLIKNALYEGPVSFFSQFELTADGRLAHDPAMLQGLNAFVKGEGLEGSIVRVTMDKSANLHLLATYYINSLLSFFNEYEHLREADLIELLKDHQDGNQTTRYQKLIHEIASSLHSLKSKQITHLEVDLFDEELPIWKVVGYFEFKPKELEHEQLKK